MFNIQVVNGDIFTTKADVLVFKYAGAFYGADAMASRLLGTETPGPMRPGAIQIVEHHSQDIWAPLILFLGVVELSAFRYENIRKFGQTSITTVSREIPSARAVAMTIHGVGY